MNVNEEFGVSKAEAKMYRDRHDTDALIQGCKDSIEMFDREIEFYKKRAKKLAWKTNLTDIDRDLMVLYVSLIKSTEQLKREETKELSLLLKHPVGSAERPGLIYHGKE